MVTVAVMVIVEVTMSVMIIMARIVDMVTHMHSSELCTVTQIEQSTSFSLCSAAV